MWGDRVGVRVIRHEEGTDPTAVIYDAIQSAKANNADVLICDTAGRLQNKVNLMKELEKMSKVISREWPEATRENLLILDATTGKNAVSQAEEFSTVSDITGIYSPRWTVLHAAVYPSQLQMSSTCLLSLSVWERVSMT